MVSFSKKRFIVIKSKNKLRHTWIDDGGKKSPLYWYTCKHCGQRKVKSDSFSCIYYDKDLNYLSNKAPECKR